MGWGQVGNGTVQLYRVELIRFGFVWRLALSGHNDFEGAPRPGSLLGNRWAGRAQGGGGGVSFPRGGATFHGIPSFESRCEPPCALAPGAQMIRMGAG
eukprot:gene11228-biopygen19864